MITPNQRNSIRIPYFQAKQEKERFERVEPAVNKISHEKIVRIWAVASYAKEFNHVMKLSVYIAAYRDRRVDNLHICLIDQDLSRFVAEDPNLVLTNQFALL